MDFIIRDANAADLPAVNRLLVATWHDTYDRIYGKQRVDEFTKRWHSIEALGRALKLPHSYFPVTACDDEIVATAFARLDSAHVIGLRRLYVTPRFQRKGLGGELLQAVIDNFPAATHLTLEVEPANGKARAFYQRHGFRVTEQANVNDGSEIAVPCQILERRLYND